MYKNSLHLYQCKPRYFFRLNTNFGTYENSVHLPYGYASHYMDFITQFLALPVCTVLYREMTPASETFTISMFVFIF